MQVRKTNLLIIRGLYPKDFSNFDAIYVEKPKVDLQKAVYSQIPKKFTDVASWPKTSNLKCWQCDRLFHSYPKFIPCNPSADGGAETCDVKGNFCEWNCAAGYVCDKYPRDMQWDALMLICIFAAKFTGRRREMIMAGPNKVLRKEYCGEGGLSMEEYQDLMDKINSDYDLSHYKMEHF